MALSDKNIVITPNKGQSSDPKIVFSGADASTGPQNITLQVYPTNSGTLSFEGSAGQLLTIKNSFSGSIFSVNDVSGVPSIEVLDSGLVKLAQYGGNVLIGTGTDAGSKLLVRGASSTSQGLLKVENTASALTNVPAAKFINTRGDHSYGIVAEFVVSSSTDGDRPSILFYGAQAAHSWQLGMGQSTTNNFHIGYRASNTPASFSTWPTSYITVKTDGSVGINNTDPAFKLSVIQASDVWHAQIGTSGGKQLRIGGSTTYGSVIGAYGTDDNTSPQSLLLNRDGGNVGIGNSNPGYKLDVSGTLNVTGLSTFRYDSGSAGWNNIVIDATTAQNGSFIRANRASASTGEVGYLWGTGGTNQWMIFLPTNSTTLTWYQGSSSVMTLTTAGTLNATNMTIGGNQVWHAGNDGAGSGLDADLIDGIGFRNTGSNEGTNADTIDSNGITYYQSGVDNFSGNSTGGALYSQRYSSSWQHQIAGDYREGNIAVRGRNNGTWARWKPIPTLTISDTAPANETRGDMWWESDTGKLKIFYDDGNSSQWVDAVPLPDFSTYYSKAGGTITGSVVTNGSITSAGKIFADAGIRIAQNTPTSNGSSGFSGGLTITNTDIRSGATSQWTGDPGAEGKIQYHSNRWYIVSDSSSDRIVQFRRNATNVSYIDNSGVYQGVSSQVIVNYNNDSNSTYQMLWGSGNSVYGTGGIYCNPFTDTLYAAVFDTTSDVRLKTDIVKIDHALEKVLKLSGYTFTLTETGQRSSGVIAQEVEEVLPEVVHGTEDKKTVSYGNMVGLLIEAIKELKQEVSDLKKQLGVN